MPITPSDYNDDAIKGQQLSKLMGKEIRDRLKGGMPETLAHALCMMAAEIDALKAALAERNLGDRTADSVDAQELKVGGVDVTDASNHTATFTQASSRTNLTTGEKLSAMFGKVMKWFADLKAVAFSGSYTDLSDKPSIPTVNDGELMVRFGDGQYSSLFSANTDATAYLDLSYRTYIVGDSHTTFYPGYPTLADMQAIYTQPDWNATEGVAAIKNKPTIPTVNNGTLTIKQGTTTLGTFTANQSGDTTVTFSDPAALPKRYWDVQEDLALTHYGAADYYKFTYLWPTGIDTDKDYIAQFTIRLEKPKSELPQLSNADMPFITILETQGSMVFDSMNGSMTCLNGKYAHYIGSASIVTRISSSYFGSFTGMEFLTYFPNNILTAADTFKLKVAVYFVEAP